MQYDQLIRFSPDLFTIPACRPNWNVMYFDISWAGHYSVFNFLKQFYFLGQPFLNMSNKCHNLFNITDLFHYNIMIKQKLLHFIPVQSLTRCLPLHLKPCTLEIALTMDWVLCILCYLLCFIWQYQWSLDSGIEV